jgi:hypothetical protein
MSEIGRLKRIAAEAWQTRTVAALTDSDAGLSSDDDELADLYELAYTRLADLSADPDVRELMVRQVVKRVPTPEGEASGRWESKATEVWSTDEWMNAVFEFLLTFAIQGALDEDTPVDVVKDEALGYVQRARDRALEPDTKPKPQLLPRRDLTQKLAFRITSGLHWKGERPPAIGKLPRPGEAARLRHEALEYQERIDDTYRDMARFEQEMRAAAALQRRKGRSIDMRTSSGGTVSVRGKRGKRGRRKR